MVDLLCGPAFGFGGQVVQAQEEHHGIVQAFGAVDGGDDGAVGGDVVGLLGAEVLLFVFPVDETGPVPRGRQIEGARMGIRDDSFFWPGRIQSAALSGPDRLRHRG